MLRARDGVDGMQGSGRRADAAKTCSAALDRCTNSVQKRLKKKQRTVAKIKNRRNRDKSIRQFRAKLPGAKLAERSLRCAAQKLCPVRRYAHPLGTFSEAHWPLKIRRSETHRMNRVSKTSRFPGWQAGKLRQDAPRCASTPKVGRQRWWITQQ